MAEVLLSDMSGIVIGCFYGVHSYFGMLLLFIVVVVGRTVRTVLRKASQAKYAVWRFMMKTSRFIQKASTLEVGIHDCQCLGRYKGQTVTVKTQGYSR